MAASDGTLTTVTGPSLEPVTLAEAKKVLRAEDFNDDDTRINALIKAARGFAEDFTNLRFYTQTVERTYDAFPANEFKLDVWPLQSVDSVKYYDTSSPTTQQTLTVNTDYYADITRIGGRIKVVTSWPATYCFPNAVAVRMTAGHSTTAAVPEQIKEGIKAYLMYLYEGDQSLEGVAKAILWPHRRL